MSANFAQDLYKLLTRNPAQYLWDALVVSSCYLYFTLLDFVLGLAFKITRSAYLAD